MLFTAWAVELWAGRIVFASEEERCRKLLQGLDVDCKDKVNGSFTCVLIMHFTVFHIICTILSFTHQWDLSLHCKLCLACEGFTVLYCAHNTFHCYLNYKDNHLFIPHKLSSFSYFEDIFPWLLATTNFQWALNKGCTMHGQAKPLTW